MNPFFRVDNRLIHGQIIASWLPHLRLTRFVVANDAVPDNELQHTMFRMAIPPGVALETLAVEATGRWLNEHRGGDDRTMVIVESIADAVRLFSKHPFPALNIGNLHHAAGHRRYTDAVYLGDTDRQALCRLAERGVRIEIRSLPHESPLDLTRALVG